jgi:hypothetical protein
MRFLSIAAPAAVAVSVLLTGGCAAADKAQACLEAPKVIGETVSKVAGLADDPKALEKELDDAAAKLDKLATDAGDTTLKEALQGLADSFQKLNVDNANAAVDAAQQAATDGAVSLKRVAAACT